MTYDELTAQILFLASTPEGLDILDRLVKEEAKHRDAQGNRLTDPLLNE